MANAIMNGQSNVKEINAATAATATTASVAEQKEQQQPHPEEKAGKRERGLIGAESRYQGAADHR